jgi:DNA-directed RNA polymerase subunit K/omega
MSNNVNNTTNKPAIASSTVTRDLRDLDVETGNIYESLVIMSKRANQISNNIKEELHQKLSEFASSNDNLEEIFENREQIEISKYYEKLPKPSLVAVQEFLDGKIYYRNPTKEA